MINYTTVRFYFRSTVIILALKCLCLLTLTLLIQMAVIQVMDLAERLEYGTSMDLSPCPSQAIIHKLKSQSTWMLL